MDKPILGWRCWAAEYAVFWCQQADATLGRYKGSPSEVADAMLAAMGGGEL